MNEYFSDIEDLVLNCDHNANCDYQSCEYKGYLCQESHLLGIIGNGVYGRALASRFEEFGHRVIIGSRSHIAKENSQLLKSEKNGNAVIISSIEETLKQCKYVFLCISSVHHRIFARNYRQNLRGKILVDVSNRKRRSRCSKTLSNAELLQGMVGDDVVVVKAFNTVSSQTLSDLDNFESRVLVCSDDHEAKNGLIEICNSAGLIGHDIGSLSNSKRIEDLPHRFFDNWRSPLIFSVVLFAILYAYALLLHLWDKTSVSWINLPLLIGNRVFGWHSIFLMAITFLGGSVASFKQLISGTSRKRFPRCLAAWMSSRKYLGLLGLWSAYIHCVMSVITNPWFTDLHYIDNTIAGGCYQFAILAGVLALSLFTFLGLTSIPGIGSEMSWKEWDFILSKLGIIGLVVSTMHVGFLAFVLDDYNVDKWKHNGVPISMLSMFIPGLVLVTKVILRFPCIWKRLKYIRENK
eukprot:TRINITY_DN8883_c0_g1_i1.p1 TRINITY_DN8883_c0_g1~~TRINITY_DN8883_c0_g1_i1.p1  ORF type:complete len:464 (-),score=34.79 TRINITY_DN8883_c0_g1_i1:37-1428(-)